MKKKKKNFNQNNVYSSLLAPRTIEKRVEFLLYVVSSLMIIVSLIQLDWVGAISTGLGCSLAYLNYRWLYVSLKSLIKNQKTSSISSISKFIFRWVIIAAAIFIALKVKYFSVWKIIFGLFSLAFAIIIESIFEAYIAIRHKLKNGVSLDTP